MEKYSRYYGSIAFVLIVFCSIFIGYTTLSQAITDMRQLNRELEQKETAYNSKLTEKRNVERKLAQIKTSNTNIQKKIYSPVDSDLGNDSLFFTLYNDVIEMIHANSIKIKSMEYSYNPENDVFVKFSRDLYFVCETNLELVSNYTNLGKLIQDIIQYPYYIRIKSIDIKPYAKDKKILISNVKLRLYAHTAPEETLE